MKRALLLAVGLALALQPTQADAQIFNGTPLAVEYQDFLGGSGVNGTYGVQVGPYRSRFVGSSMTARSTATPQFSVYCVDYLHFANDSDGLTNVTALNGSLGSASNTRLGSLASYRSSAYLSSLFDDGVWQTHMSALAANPLNAGYSFNQNNVWGGLHAAIWQTSTGPATGVSGAAAVAMNYFMNQASANAGSFDITGWYVLTDADVATAGYTGRTGQEFLMRTDVRSVPEPGTMLLMLTGIGLLFVANRRRLVQEL